jgi:hypothetical protein
MQDSTDITMREGSTAEVRVVHRHTNMTITAITERKSRAHIRGPPFSKSSISPQPIVLRGSVVEMIAGMFTRQV